MRQTPDHCNTDDSLSVVANAFLVLISKPHLNGEILPKVLPGDSSHTDTVSLHCEFSCVSPCDISGWISFHTHHNGRAFHLHERKRKRRRWMQIKRRPWKKIFTYLCVFFHVAGEDISEWSACHTDCTETASLLEFKIFHK